MTTSEYTDALRALADPGLPGLHFPCVHTHRRAGLLFCPQEYISKVSMVMQEHIRLLYAEIMKGIVNLHLLIITTFWSSNDNVIFH